jgi:hypothetical protein
VSVAGGIDLACIDAVVYFASQEPPNTISGVLDIVR